MTWESRGWFSIPKIENWTVAGSTLILSEEREEKDENVRSTYSTLYPVLKAEREGILVHSVGYTR
jgi:hypothetical protein